MTAHASWLFYDHVKSHSTREIIFDYLVLDGPQRVNDPEEWTSEKQMGHQQERNVPFSSMIICFSYYLSTQGTKILKSVMRVP